MTITWQDDRNLTHSINPLIQIYLLSGIVVFEWSLERAEERKNKEMRENHVQHTRTLSVVQVAQEGNNWYPQRRENSHQEKNEQNPLWLRSNGKIYIYRYIYIYRVFLRVRDFNGAGCPNPDHFRVHQNSTHQSCLLFTQCPSRSRSDDRYRSGIVQRSARHRFACQTCRRRCTFPVIDMVKRRKKTKPMWMKWWQRDEFEASPLW